MPGTVTSHPFVRHVLLWLKRLHSEEPDSRAMTMRKHPYRLPTHCARKDSVFGGYLGG